MNVKSTTRIYGIFGHPIEHSLSPVMQNNAFSERDLDSVYVAFDVPPPSLSEAVSAIRALGISGINVTVPHKESIMAHLDEISTDAMLVGAVNTISNIEGRLIGFNTDVGGFLRALKDDLDFTPEGKKVFLMGAGGAARAVIVGLGRNYVSEIVITNRTLSKAEDLAKEFGDQFPKVEIKAVMLSDEERIKKYIGGSDILINASSAGMNGDNPLELPLYLLPKSAVIYDLVYQPKETPLIKDAKKAGIKAVSGHSMLLFQGAEAFEIWTGLVAPVKTMKKALELYQLISH
ncbi:MAG: shikimate dehydrogenase [Thermodesulfobacteriota bacterium]